MTIRLFVTLCDERSSAQDLPSRRSQTVNSPLKAYRREPTDVVITDIVMPDKEGLQTIMELRRCDANVRIIAISGGGIGRASDYLATARALAARG